MIFVNSMSDLFHEDIPEDYIAEIFDVMVRAGHHTFQAQAFGVPLADILAAVAERFHMRRMTGGDLRIDPPERITLQVQFTPEGGPTQSFEFDQSFP